MPVTPTFAKNLLDWSLGGAAAVRPTGVWFQFATSAPTTANDYPGPFTNRMTATMSPAISPAGSMTNLNALVRTATAAATMVGWNIYDTAGNRLMFGTLTAGIGCGSGDGCRLTAGNLQITIA